MKNAYVYFEKGAWINVNSLHPKGTHFDMNRFKTEESNWEPFVEKPKVEFKKFWKWIYFSYGGCIRDTEWYYDDDKKRENSNECER